MSEVEAESESPEAQQPPPGAEPEKSEGQLEEVWSLRGVGGAWVFAVSFARPPARSSTNLHPHSHQHLK